MDLMKGWVAMALLLLLLLARAGGHVVNPGLCGIRSARSCADFQPSSEDVDYIGCLSKCAPRYSVLAPTLTDVLRLPDSYLVVADMPGVSSTTLNLTASPGRLSFSGIVRDPEPPSLWAAARDFRGPPLKLFGREFLLPDHVQADKVSHNIDNGVLRVTLPVDTTHPDHSRLDLLDVEEGEPSTVAFMRTMCSCERGELPPQPLASTWSDWPASCNGSGVFTMQPLTDVTQAEASLELVAEMPGVEPDSIRVSSGVDCSSDKYRLWCIVSVSGAVREEDDRLQGVQSLRIERGPSSRLYTARFAVIPFEYDGANVTYHLTNEGLLRATIHRPAGADAPVRTEL